MFIRKRRWFRVALILAPVAGAIQLRSIANEGQTPTEEEGKLKTTHADASSRAPLNMRAIEALELRSKRAAIESTVPFANPPELHSGAGKLTATLVVDYAYNRIGSQDVKLRSYNGLLVGPTMRVKPGDKLVVKVLNELPDEKVTAHDGDVNKPHGFSTTNLHTHGLHVSPEGSSDNVFLEIPPHGRQDFQFNITATHPPGTHWYHPHKHGSVAVQVSSGMAGALIVEGGLDAIPEIAAAQERIFVFQQVIYSGDGTLEDFGPIQDWPSGRTTIINGLLQPVIEMAPEEVQRWRFIDSGIAEKLDLAIKTEDETASLKFHEVAADGIAFGDIYDEDVIHLGPGYRSDVLVKAPATEGDYLLLDLRAEANRGLRFGVFESQKALARIHVCGNARPMKLPQRKQLEHLAPYPKIDAYTCERTLKFNGADPVWTINGEQFDPIKTKQCPKVGTAEQWTLISESNTHPFHIHVNPFVVLSDKDHDGNETLCRPIWKDTVLLENQHTIVFRTRFEDYDGKTVLHCHKFDHEDQGMMQTVQILPPCAQADCPKENKAANSVKLFSPAPPWRLPDANGTVHDFQDLAGKPAIVVFYRGMSCLHCVQQLRALEQRSKQIDALGIKVVGIGTDDSATLHTALEEYSQTSTSPFLLLADPNFEVFKKFQCFEDKPMHGIFLIDKAGRIRWKAVTDAPFDNIDWVLELAQSLDKDQ